MTQDKIVELAIQGHASTRDAIRWAMNQEREAIRNICKDEQGQDSADLWNVCTQHIIDKIDERQ